VASTGDAQNVHEQEEDRGGDCPAGGGGFAVRWAVDCSCGAHPAAGDDVALAARLTAHLAAAHAAAADGTGVARSMVAAAGLLGADPALGWRSR
jgi:hypothetical protein